MKTVVLDATELSRDFMCRGLKYQLLEHADYAVWLNVVVPASVFEEVVANHARKVTECDQALRRLNLDRERLGLGVIDPPKPALDYRQFLTERFDDQLGVQVLPWPSTNHEALVSRAVSRTSPFDDKGGGYRDTLVWVSVLELAKQGKDVALVSADRAFASPDGVLADALAAEIEPLQGSVELVRDFGAWLLEQLPWEAESLQSAVATARTERFYNYFLQSDFQADLEPQFEDLGFRWPVHEFEITECDWNGHFQAVNTRTSPDGLILVEYDIGQSVTFQAVVDNGTDVEPGWYTSDPDLLNRVQVEGEVDMIARVAVLFGDEFGFSVDDLSWRRTDDSGPGSPMYWAHNPNQLSLLDPDPD
ncbi:PIN domain-containing protein [Mycolicibacterium sp.]|uniref:PIN domain-containing protein n=1 Tax=Mycolicibacterium sp. TaxID=2320850 RepID=UPI0037C6C028